MKSTYRIPTLGWILLGIMFLLNIAAMTGTVTGVIPDVIRLVASVGAILVIGVSYLQHRRNQ